MVQVRRFHSNVLFFIPLTQGVSSTKQLPYYPSLSPLGAGFIVFFLLIDHSPALGPFVAVLACALVFSTCKDLASLPVKKRRVLCAVCACLSTRDLFFMSKGIYGLRTVMSV